MYSVKQFDYSGEQVKVILIAKCPEFETAAQIYSLMNEAAVRFGKNSYNFSNRLMFGNKVICAASFVSNPIEVKGNNK